MAEAVAGMAMAMTPAGCGLPVVGGVFVVVVSGVAVIVSISSVVSTRVPMALFLR